MSCCAMVLSSAFARMRGVTDFPLIQELYRPESTHLEKAPAAQLTRVDAADRLFSVPLHA